MRTGALRVTRAVAALTALIGLVACVADQSPSIPPDPAAPFPLPNSRIMAQPSPGAIIVEARFPVPTPGAITRAAREWCGGAAQAAYITNDEDRFVVRSETWIVRCR